MSRAFYLSSSSGGFDIFLNDGTGKVVAHTLTERDAALVVQAMDHYPHVILYQDNFIGAFNSVEEAQEAISIASSLSKLVGPHVGSTIH